MSTTREQAAPRPTGSTTRGTEPATHAAADIASVGALVSRRSSSGFGAEPRSF